MATIEHPLKKERIYRPVDPTATPFGLLTDLVDCLFLKELRGDLSYALIAHDVVLRSDLSFREQEIGGNALLRVTLERSGRSGDERRRGNYESSQAIIGEPVIGVRVYSDVLRSLEIVRRSQARLARFYVAELKVVAQTVRNSLCESFLVEFDAGPTSSSHGELLHVPRIRFISSQWPLHDSIDSLTGEVNLGEAWREEWLIGDCIAHIVGMLRESKRASLSAARSEGAVR